MTQKQNSVCPRWLIAVVYLVGMSTPTMSQTILVPGTARFQATNLQATPGQLIRIQATGSVNLAVFEGPYITNADGTILIAPPRRLGRCHVFYDECRSRRDCSYCRSEEKYSSRF